MVALRSGVAGQGSAGIGHMFVEASREPGLVEQDMLGDDRLAVVAGEAAR
jgi:hypothetical protein